MSDTVVRHRIATTTTDAGGNTVAATWATQVLPGAWLFAPGPSDDITAINRDGVEVTPRLYGPHDADVTDRDRIEVRGHTYRVVGVPMRWEHEGVVVALERTDG